MFTKSKRTFTLVAITTAACLCCLTLALAGKPDKPGGVPRHVLGELQKNN